jgi:hypothetical protein
MKQGRPTKDCLAQDSLERSWSAFEAADRHLVLYMFGVRFVRACLLLALLACTSIGVSCEEGKVEPGKQRQLDKELASAIAAQRKKQNATGAVEAHIVEEAPKAALASGDGDIATNGG